MTIDFEHPSEEANAIYERILQYLRESSNDLTLWANSGGGGNIYYEKGQLIHSWREAAEMESTRKQMHPQRDRSALLNMLYDRAKRFIDPDDLPLETALLRFLKHYAPDDPLLEGKPDPGVL